MIDKIKSKLDLLSREIYIRLLSVAFIPNWLITSSDRRILDIGCGQGLSMKLIKLHYKNLSSVGADIFKPYIDKCKKEKIHDEYILSDVRKLKFKESEFDVVLCLQLIEHLEKDDALKLIREMELWTKRIIIIATPIGKTSYHTEDNIYQEHRSYFYPKELQKLGYKIIRMGGKSLFEEDRGLAFKVKSEILRRMIIVLDIFLTPFYLIFQPYANYYFYAYKVLDK